MKGHSSLSCFPMARDRLRYRVRVERLPAHVLLLCTAVYYCCTTLIPYTACTQANQLTATPTNASLAAICTKLVFSLISLSIVVALVHAAAVSQTPPTGLHAQEQHKSTTAVSHGYVSHQECTATAGAAVVETAFCSPPPLVPIRLEVPVLGAPTLQAS